jgi:Tfp pilus assembly protein PilO
MAISATQKWYAAAAGASVAVLAGGWFLLVSPQQSNAADITSQADAVTNTNHTTELQIAALKAQFKNLPQLQSDVAAIRTRIPQTPNEPTLLRALSTLAKSSGVKLTNLQVQTPAPVAGAPAVATTPGTNPLAAPGQVTAIPLQIEIKGTFADTRLFLNGLENMSRSMLVTGLDIIRDSSPTGGNAIKTNVASRIFMANPGAVAAAAPVAAAVTTPNSPS